MEFAQIDCIAGAIGIRRKPFVDGDIVIIWIFEKFEYAVGDYHLAVGEVAVKSILRVEAFFDRNEAMVAQRGIVRKAGKISVEFVLILIGQNAAYHADGSYIKAVIAYGKATKFAECRVNCHTREHGQNLDIFE